MFIFSHNKKSVKKNGAGPIWHHQVQEFEEFKIDSDARFEDIFLHFSEIEQIASIPAWPANRLLLPKTTKKTIKIKLVTVPTETSHKRASGVDSIQFNIFYFPLL